MMWCMMGKWASGPDAPIDVHSLPGGAGPPNDMVHYGEGGRSFGALVDENRLLEWRN